MLTADQSLATGYSLTGSSSKEEDISGSFPEISLNCYLSLLYHHPESLRPHMNIVATAKVRISANGAYC